MPRRLEALSFRHPEETSPRMRALSRLPVFLSLEGKRALVCGNAAAAAWKAELLSAAGAHVDVICDAPGEEPRALAADAPHGAISIAARAWHAGDFAGAAVAIGAMTDDAEAERFAAAARSAGIPVNVIDKPRLCDFIFGAIVNRSPLVIGISTDGAAPVFAQAIRAKIEGLLPRGFARWAEAARRWRTLVQATDLPSAARRRFWQLFTAAAVSNPDRDPATRDFDALLAVTRAEPSAGAGRVTLVGAGPGNPELLTLRAVRALQSADVILFDDLVAPDILDFARREAKKMLVGKTGHAPSCRQDDINALMISLAKAGRSVVRLKGGDPLIFGRADEEIAACRAAGIAVEVVPGITTAQGAASRLLISLTRRATARRVQYITGHATAGNGRDAKLPADIDWNSLADPAATSVVYMPTKTLPELVTTALRAGLDPATPAVAIERATRSGERVIAATVAELPARLAAAAPSGPVVVMIGRVFAEYVEDAANHTAADAAASRQSRA
jgi:uroporphyrin-III C-methyltransferase / precorrin-2 dehydrogenase / sirohydrochlorin ferrochelatase